MPINLVSVITCLIVPWPFLNICWCWQDLQAQFKDTIFFIVYPNQEFSLVCICAVHWEMYHSFCYMYKQDAELHSEITVNVSACGGKPMVWTHITKWNPQHTRTRKQSYAIHCYAVYNPTHACTHAHTHTHQHTHIHMYTHTYTRYKKLKYFTFSVSPAPSTSPQLTEEEKKTCTGMSYS